MVNGGRRAVAGAIGCRGFILKLGFQHHLLCELLRLKLLHFAFMGQALRQQRWHTAAQKEREQQHRPTQRSLNCHGEEGLIGVGDGSS
jgi:hypothetical protein